jgi:hypothetical protein
MTYTVMNKEDVKDMEALLRRCFPYLFDRTHPTRYRTKAEREREIQFGAGNEHAQWWAEQNRLDAMRRGE